MMPLGVFTSIYPDGVMTIPRALLIAAVGFLLVFLILGAIALFVKLMGAVFDRVTKSKKAPTIRQTSSPESDNGTVPLPDNTSKGALTLENVTEEEAAVIMAIVSNQSGIPLNRLQFNSIRLLEENKV